METYQNNFEILKKTFLKFINQLPFYGLVVVCLDCPVIRSLLKNIKRSVITYGFSEDADYQITEYQQIGHQSTFVVKRPHLEDLSITLNLPGRHNAQNATAAMVVGLDEGVSDEVICKTFAEFKGVGRRFNIYGEFALSNTDSNSIMLVDDYGHHPNEVMATIQAVRQGWPDRRLVMAFQPHRYSRTRDLFDDFVEVLSQVDVLLLLEVYSAGEAPIVGINSQALCDALEQYKHTSPVYVNKVENLKFHLDSVLKPGDILLTQGAGNIGSFAGEWIASRKAESA
jgi:UDP-N-acetylmuramate--alanine ligase